MEEWTIQVVGDEAAVSRLADVVSGVAELRDDRGDVLLVHPDWQGLATAGEVAEAGAALLAQANGLIRLQHPEMQALRSGGAIRLMGGGARTYYDSATMRLRMTISARVEHIGADGLPVPPPPDPSPGWIAKATADPARGRAVREFGTASTWPDLYKVYEVIRQGLGGQKAVDALVGKAERSRFTQSAQLDRHADSAPHANPMTMDQGREFIARLLMHWLSQP
jgi:hypothetical protein